MRRREFISVVGGAASWPLAARAQQRTMPVIGYLDTASASITAHLVAAFRQGLSVAGYDEGRNVAIEYRWPDGDYDKLPSLADELVRRNVAVIATINTPTVLAAKRATKTIPIVFAVGVDPVKFGLVESLNRPAGNLTGLTQLNIEMEAKRVQLLHELAPSATSIALLIEGGRVPANGVAQQPHEVRKGSSFAPALFSAIMGHAGAAPTSASSSSKARTKLPGGPRRGLGLSQIGRQMPALRSFTFLDLKCGSASSRAVPPV
jgi:putative tryptophan/tyrosine transport system substrate-binding protein